MILSGSVPCFKNKTSKNDKNNFNKMKIKISIFTNARKEIEKNVLL